MTRIAGQRLIGRLCGALGACGTAAGAAAARLVLGVGRAEDAGGAWIWKGIIDWGADGQRVNLGGWIGEEGWIVDPVARLGDAAWCAASRRSAGEGVAGGGDKDFFDRSTFSANFTTDMSDKLKAIVHTKYSNIQGNGHGGGQIFNALNFDPTVPVMTDGKYSTSILSNSLPSRLPASNYNSLPARLSARASVMSTGESSTDMS